MAIQEQDVVSEKAASKRKKRLYNGIDNIESSKRQQKIKAKTVLVDDLAWKEVSVPSRFEDAEGFFGLEEIDNVEVVKDSENGKVNYRVEPKSFITSAALETDLLIEASLRRDVPDEAEGGEDWGGFDEELPARPISRSIGSDVRRGKREPKIIIKDEPKKQREKKQKSRKGQNTSVDRNDFGLLNEEGDSEVDVSAWYPLGLSSETLLSLARMKFPRPTPIQGAAIPEIISGHDVIGKASTGSGKTLAFGIPIFERYLSLAKSREKKGKSTSQERRHPPVAMILSPTRELAHQLSAHLTELCLNASTAEIRIATLTGGLSLQKQQRLLADADVIIGTPGRLWEMISNGQGLVNWLKQIQFLVLDEADRLLSEGHFREVEDILSSLDWAIDDPDSTQEYFSQDRTEVVQRQTLVFSATFQKSLQQKLAGKGKTTDGDILGKQESMEYLLKKLNFREGKPKFVDVNPISQMASGLKEGIVECAGLEKDLYLYALLLYHRNIRTLIFTNSITAVRRLTPFLQNLNIAAYALHSQMPQKARLRSVERFSSPSQPGSILIATDVAARGLDIPSVQIIIHYHLPRAADMYVHRSGRTARAEKSGTSILLCAPEEVVGVRRLIAKVHARNAGPDDENSKKFFMRTIELDRWIVARLKPRAVLSKRISDATIAKEKSSHEDNWLRTAADDLGVDYDSEEFAAQGTSAKGRGQGRKKAEREAKGIGKGEMAGLRAELKALLGQRVNVGVSERYLSAGGVDVDELLNKDNHGEFLGRIDGLGLE